MMIYSLIRIIINNNILKSLGTKKPPLLCAWTVWELLGIKKRSGGSVV